MSVSEHVKERSLFETAPGPPRPARAGFLLQTCRCSPVPSLQVMLLHFVLTNVDEGRVMTSVNACKKMARELGRILTWTSNPIPYVIVQC